MARKKKYNPPYDFPKCGRKLQNNKSGLTDDQLLDRMVYEHIEGPLLTKTRAAKLLGVSRTTIYEMLDDGRLKLGRDGKVDTRSVWAFARGVTMA